MDLTTAAVITYAGQKILGKTLDEMGKDFLTLYKNGRDKILEKASKKIDNIDDNKIPNLRVARDVFWNGSFTDEDICAEYFSGMLASSRSEDGKDDNAIHYLNIIQSLSSKQLNLHYVLYNSLNKLFIKNNKYELNVGLSSEIQNESIYFSAIDLIDNLKLNVDTDLNVLHNQGLIFEYRTDNENYSDNKILSYTMVRPTTLGIILYSLSHNKLNLWRSFTNIDLGNFEDINLPNYFSSTIEELKNFVN